MLAVLPVWLGQVCNGSINWSVQLLVEKEGMAVDTQSASIRTGKERNQDGVYREEISGPAVRKWGPKG